MDNLVRTILVKIIKASISCLIKLKMYKVDENKLNYVSSMLYTVV